MKKIRFLATMILLFSVLACLIGPAESAHADGNKTGTEAGAKEVLWRAYVEYYFLENEEDYKIENFNPSAKATYGQIAQWLYNSHFAPETYPSQTKAMKWIKKAYKKVASRYPDYSDEILAAFYDGKGDAFSKKQQVTWKWVMNTVYVLAYYCNSPFSKRNVFSFDTTQLDYECLGPDMSISGYFHGIWKKTYGGKKTKPNKIEAIDALLTLAPKWDW